ncbi:MAG: restriction endonuclease [Xanthomonadaceae bacterium]|nr:restriction endonuclease [Xanthomonadaceae bacterium]
MGGWVGWLIPIGIFLLIGAASSFYLQRVRLPREEAAAGVTALAAMRWRDFMQLVLDALLRRGYERVFDPDTASEDGDYVLEREGQRYLLSSKRGAAYVVGSTAIAEFASAIRLRAAAGGLLVTPGRFAPEALPLARAQRIELLDGPTLWPELRLLLTAEQRAAISTASQAGFRRNVLLAWSGALVIAAVMLSFVWHGNVPEAAPDSPASVATAVADTAPAFSHARRTAQARPSTPHQDSSVAPVDPAQLEVRRNQTAAAISELPGIDRAIWQTQSTLLVYLLDDQFDPLREICPELARYDELAATRLQLQPPANSTRSVRFVQCRAY